MKINLLWPADLENGPNVMDWNILKWRRIANGTKCLIATPGTLRWWNILIHYEGGADENNSCRRKILASWVERPGLGRNRYTNKSFCNAINGYMGTNILHSILMDSIMAAVGLWQRIGDTWCCVQLFGGWLCLNNFQHFYINMRKYVYATVCRVICTRFGSLVENIDTVAQRGVVRFKKFQIICMLTLYQHPHTIFSVQKKTGKFAEFGNNFSNCVYCNSNFIL